MKTDKSLCEGNISFTCLMPVIFSSPRVGQVGHSRSQFIISERTFIYGVVILRHRNRKMICMFVLLFMNKQTWLFHVYF